MPLTALKVLELKLVEGLCDRELNNPEGVGLDLRVGEVYKISEGEGFLGIEERSNPKIELIAKYNPEKKDVFTINPGEYYLVKTLEIINTPSEKIVVEENLPAKYVMPLVYPRSSLQRNGISFHATKTDPGYCGELTFGISNLGKNPFKFELGARMFNIIFHPVSGEISRTYDGQHQGGRVSSDGKSEIQN